MDKIKYRADDKLNKVFYLNKDQQATLPVLLNGRLNVSLHHFVHSLDLYQYLKSGHSADVLLLDVESQGFEFLELLLQTPFPKKTPIILISPEVDSALMQKARAFGVDDIFSTGNLNQHFLTRLNYLVKKYYLSNKRPQVQSLKAEIKSDLNRATNFILSITSFTLFAPLLAVLAGLIKLGSVGPVFQRSKRMGPGGKIIEVYKFRTTTEARIITEKFPRLQLVTRNVKYKILGWPTHPAATALFFQGIMSENQKFRFTEKKNLSPPSQIKSRETWIGKWLKKTQLNELPLILNMVKGEEWFLPKAMPAHYPSPLDNVETYPLRFASQLGPVTLKDALQRQSEAAETEKGMIGQIEIMALQNLWSLVQSGIKTAVASKKAVILSAADHQAGGDNQVSYT